MRTMRERNRRGLSFILAAAVLFSVFFGGGADRLLLMPVHILLVV
jgi:hypothetical protein